MFIFLSRLPDLNWAPTAYDAVALPDELRRLEFDSRLAKTFFVR